MEYKDNFRIAMLHKNTHILELLQQKTDNWQKV